MKAILIVDLQNDFLHEKGAYGRGGQKSAAIAALPARLKPLLEKARGQKILTLSTNFTLVTGMGGEPIISPHLKQLRPFLTKGDFESGAWGHDVVDELKPIDVKIEKIAYSAFYMTRLEWVLRKLGVSELIVAGIVTNGGVASTVREAHVRDFHVTVLEDGCATFDDITHQTAIAALKPVARIASIAEILHEI
jgi:ureidoacrylate peracid hydrolase